MASPRIQRELDEAIQILQTASKSGVGATLRRIRVSKALTALRKVESSCTTESDSGHVKGQILLVQCRLIDEICEGETGKHDRAELYYQIEEALDIWTWLHTHPEHQYRQLECTGQFRRCLSDVLTKHINRPDREDLLHGLQIRLTKAHRAYKDPFLMVALFDTSHTILQECLDHAHVFYRSGSWALALSLLTSKDAELDELVELEEKLKAYPNFVTHGLGYKLGDASVIREEYQTLFASCKCSQLIHFGDLHFKEAVNGDPEDIFSRGLLAQDDFRVALHYAAGQDIELEGMVLVRLALFHAKISKVPVTAHQLYLRAVQLAAALQPALPKGSWYKESVDAVQAYRDALEAEEAKKWENARKPILEKLSGDIDKLNGAKNKEDADFVKFVFESWPPKTEGGPNPPLDPADPTTLSKKQLLKAIQRYHTDRNSSWGDEWRVLSEEIAKALTARYNTMKGM